MTLPPGTGVTQPASGHWHYHRTVLGGVQRAGSEARIQQAVDPWSLTGVPRQGAGFLESVSQPRWMASSCSGLTRGQRYEGVGGTKGVSCPVFPWNCQEASSRKDGEGREGRASRKQGGTRGSQDRTFWDLLLGPLGDLTEQPGPSPLPGREVRAGAWLPRWRASRAHDRQGTEHRDTHVTAQSTHTPPPATSTPSSGPRSVPSHVQQPRAEQGCSWGHGPPRHP